MLIGFFDRFRLPEKRKALLEIVYFKDIFLNVLAIVGAAAYIDNMLSNRNA